MKCSNKQSCLKEENIFDNRLFSFSPRSLPVLPQRTSTNEAIISPSSLMVTDSSHIHHADFEYWNGPSSIAMMPVAKSLRNETDGDDNENIQK